MLAWRTLYPLNHLPSPENDVYKCNINVHINVLTVKELQIKMRAGVWCLWSVVLSSAVGVVCGPQGISESISLVSRALVT